MLDNNQNGFTLPELIIGIGLSSALAVTILGILMNYFSIMHRQNITVDMTVDSQNLLRSTVEELRYGAGVRQTNSIVDLNGPGGGWNTNNTSFVIIIASPVTDNNGDYVIDPITGNPYNNELVYFQNGRNLYRRTLTNPLAIGNTKKTTCPPVSASSLCPADVLLNENVRDMVFTLYDQDNNSTTNALLARSVRIDIQMERDTFGQPLQVDNSIRITLRNEFS